MPPEAKAETPKNLYAKLAEVMEAVGRVPKNGRNDFHKYDYVTEADLVEAVRSELSSRGIVLLSDVVDVSREGTLTTAAVTFTLIDSHATQIVAQVCEDNDEPRVVTDSMTLGLATAFSGTYYGTGEDKGDKGLYKAYTGALKYFLMKNFLIPTGDDPEGDTETDKRAAKKPAEKIAEQVVALPGTVELATKTQLTKLAKAKEMLGATRFDAYLRAQGVDSPEELAKDAAESVLEWARNQAKAKAAA